MCVCRRSSLGLRGLAASLLGVELDKSWRLRCSDWEANTLSDQQVHSMYVCTHAHVYIICIYVSLMIIRNVLISHIPVSVYTRASYFVTLGGLFPFSHVWVVLGTCALMCIAIIIGGIIFSNSIPRSPYLWSGILL